MSAKEILEKLQAAREEARQEIKRIDDQLAQLQAERKELVASLGSTVKGIKHLKDSAHSGELKRRPRKKAEIAPIEPAPETKAVV